MSEISMAATTSSGWSGIPADLLRSILNRLPAGDYLRCRAVCSTWSKSPRGPTRIIEAPWIMIPRPHRNGNVDNDGYSLCFYSISERRTYRLGWPCGVDGLRCIATTEIGFLVVTDKIPNLHLLNPITGSMIPLPPVTTFSDIHDVIRGPDGTVTGYVWNPVGSLFPENYGLDHKMLSYYRKVTVFSRLGVVIVTVIHGDSWYPCASYTTVGMDPTWTVLDNNFRLVRRIVSLAHHRGKFHGLLLGGSVMIFEEEREIESPTGDDGVFFSTYYLVEGRDLLLVWRQWDEEQSETSFMVFRLVEGKEEEWEFVDGLGDTCLFLGGNRSLQFSTLEVPELKRNCIYFTEIESDDGIINKCAGVYDMKDGSVSPLYDNQMRFQGALHHWFMPAIL